MAASFCSLWLHILTHASVFWAARPLDTVELTRKSGRQLATRHTATSGARASSQRLWAQRRSVNRRESRSSSDAAAARVLAGLVSGSSEERSRARAHDESGASEVEVAAASATDERRESEVAGANASDEVAAGAAARRAALQAAAEARGSDEQYLETDAAVAFEHFIKKHGREYAPGSAEYVRRQALFKERHALALRHNSDLLRLWSAGTNRFSDRTEEEISKLKGWKGGTGGRSGGSARPRSGFLQGGRSLTRKALPGSVSWQNLWATKRGQIHNQGDCGCCWAAATASALEAHAEIYQKQTRHYSIGEITHCTSNEDLCGGTGGCEGATAELALQHVMVDGISFRDSDDFSGHCPSKSKLHDSLQHGSDDPQGWPEGERRRPQASASLSEFGAVNEGSQHVAANGTTAMSMPVASWERLPVNDYESLMRALVEYGPVVISVATNAMESKQRSMYQYSSGIFDACGRDAVVEHSMLGIGYGQAGGKGYWLIQNSWGPDWGEHGRMRILRRLQQVDGQPSEAAYCGVDRQPELGTGCKDGPKEVKVCGTCGILYDNVVPHFDGVMGIHALTADPPKAATDALADAESQ